MCRLFALISKDKKDAGYWFFEADPAFKEFSEKVINRGPHNSGWGIAWLEDTNWKLFKQGKEDSEKYDFEKVRQAKSNLLMIHLRHASVGAETTENAHPFVYKNWCFEHNGGVAIESVKKLLQPEFKKRFTSKTDSEVYFFLIMQFYEKSKDILLAIKEAVKIVKKYDYRGLNFILSDGKKIYAFRDVSPEKRDLFDYYCLHYLVKKDSIVVSSDPLSKENWIPVGMGELLIVDERLGQTRIRV